MEKDERSRPHEPTAPLDAGQGAPDAAVQEVYHRLQAAARRHLRKVRTPHTLEPAELISEAWLRLQRAPESSLMDREVFYAIASTTMRHVLLDYEKHRSRVKRGGPDKDLELKPDLLGERTTRITVIGLHRALARLEDNDPMLARLIELRFFGGLTVEQAAHELGCSPRTAAREWTVAKAWLRRELG